MGDLGTVSVPLWAFLGRSRGLCGRSWALMMAMLAVLDCSWGLGGRSCAALGAYVRGPGPSWDLC